MNTLFQIAGIVYTIIGTIAIAIISGIYIAVKFFGLVISFGVLKKTSEGEQE